jgi:Na+-translocating ferredoxin:NAD+ oxidoreductase subunit G
MPEFAKMVGVLFIACGVSAGSLAVVNLMTREPIAAGERKAKDDALRQVFASADEFKEITPNRVWEARAQGQPVGVVLQAETPGYSGQIRMMFGVGPDGTLTGFKVLSHTETPGLGAKITTPEFCNQFKNKSLAQLVLRQENPDQGQIDAITAATISSRAVTKAVSSALAAHLKDKEAVP